MRRLSDEELIEVYKTNKGNLRRKAFDYLYLRHTENLKNYFFFALGRDNEKAKDFAHDLFIKILESPEKFDSNKRFKPWIYKVASNMCKNDFRKREIIGKYETFIQHTTIDHDVSDTKGYLLRECMKKLPQEQRSLIVLRFKIKLSIKEMAKIYECPEGTIKSRLFYAVKELSQHYIGYDHG